MFEEYFNNLGAKNEKNIPAKCISSQAQTWF